MEDLKDLVQDIEECKISEINLSKAEEQSSIIAKEHLSKNQQKNTLKQKRQENKNDHKSEQKQNISKQPNSKPERKKPIDQIKELNYVEIGTNGSQISIWHRPTPTHINLLKCNQDITLIVSLQGEREHVSEVQKACLSNGINWFNIPLEGANETLLSSLATRQMIQKRLIELKEFLKKSQQKALLHCAAGIHRTGTVTYSLLRIFGHTQESAMNQLNILREITFQQVGLHRIDIAERYFVKPILEGNLDLNDDSQNQQQQQEQIKDEQQQQPQNIVSELIE